METLTNNKHSDFESTSPMFAVFSNTPLLNAENKLHCLEALQQSLDLKDLMTNFATLTAKFVRPLGMRFQSAHGFFSLPHTKNNAFSKSFNLGAVGQMPRLGTITYQSDKALTVKEDKTLTELHKLLLPNLKHALRFSELNFMVYKDYLTGIGNRAYYEASLQHAIEQSSRTLQGLALMVLDINDFKPINDTYGHLKGDQILKAFAQVLTKSARTSDMIFRIGGDEFAIILLPAESCSVMKVHQRLLQEIDNDSILTEAQFSASIGHSTWEIGMSATQLFEEADNVLYHQKSLHRKS